MQHLLAPASRRNLIHFIFSVGGGGRRRVDTRASCGGVRIRVYGELGRCQKIRRGQGVSTSALISVCIFPLLILFDWFLVCPHFLKLRLIMQARVSDEFSGELAGVRGFSMVLAVLFVPSGASSLACLPPSLTDPAQKPGRWTSSTSCSRMAVVVGVVVCQRRVDTLQRHALSSSW